MKEKQKMLSDILTLIAEELNISKTMQEKAVSSYKAVGKWIGEGVEYDVEITPQGSMNLGTVVRPVNDNDDGYDMDLVCILKDGQELSAESIKHIVGNRLEEHNIYSDKLDAEGKRCWTMEYDGFHMDILPCVPKDVYYKPEHTAIRLTHKNEEGTYENRYSNPYQYLLWFESCMKEPLKIAKAEYVVKAEVEIDEVPTYKVRTPLQQAVQLLKRHRDLHFGDDKDAPISIIITTLAAKAYNGEMDLYEALCNIVHKMPEFIELRGDEYWIPNPVIQEENFADKWNENANKRTAFFEWLSSVRKDLLEDPLNCFGIPAVGEKLAKSLGTAPVTRAFNKYGEISKGERTKGNLYVNGLQGGITTKKEDTIPIKEHNFYGV